MAFDLGRLLGRDPGPGFPIDRLDERSYAADWQGDIVTCDIDRTYLATRFSSLRGLARIPLEFGIDKVDIAGMASLLKELRRGPGEQSRQTPLYFVSASPVQLRPVIQRKMLLDGLEYDGTTFKPWGTMLLAGRSARLREQVGYKITALLLARRSFPLGAKEFLLGDDIESDPLSFAAYADILAGRLAGSQLLATLESLGVASDDAAYIGELATQVGSVDAVRRIYIRLERGEAEELQALAPQVRACRGAFQMALGFLDDGAITPTAVVRVARDLRRRGTRPEELGERFADALLRGILAAPQAEALQTALLAEDLLVGTPGALPAPHPAWSKTSDDGYWLPASYRAS